MTKKYIYMAIIIITLGLYLTQNKYEPVNPDLPRINAKNLTRIVITRADGTITLEKTGDLWQVLPGTNPADRKKAADIIETIEKFKIIMIISDYQDYTVFGLDSRNKIIVTAYIEDTVVREFEVGNTGPSRAHTFVRLSGDDRIYYAVNPIRDIFDLTAVELTQ